MDYVGNERSPLWDEMEAMEDENAKIGGALPGLDVEILKLQQSLLDSKIKTRMIECYK